MRKFVIFIILLITSEQVKSQFKVVDSTTIKGIPYVAIKFDSNNGLYTNNKGVFSIKDITVDSIWLSSLGYKTRLIKLNELTNNVIYLSPKSYELKEVLISNKKIKSKKVKVKPQKHDKIQLSHWMMIGEEVAILLENNFNSNDVDILNVSFPIINKTISFDKDMAGKTQRLSKLPFSTLFRITFYENFDGLPGEQINFQTITILIDEKSDIITLDLEKFDIRLPIEGLFVGILNLGSADEKGNLISSSPFVYKENSKGENVKFIRPTKPFLPVHFYEQKHKTFTRYSFDDNQNWRYLQAKTKMKNEKYHNFSLGCEVVVY